MRISDWSSDVCSSDLVVFEGVPTYPHVGRFWEMIQRHKVTVFYTAPTAIRSLTKAAEGAPEYHPREYDLGSLRIIRSEEHTSELQSLMRISYAVFCLSKNTPQNQPYITQFLFNKKK